MSEILKKDPAKAEEEKIKKELMVSETEMRETYFKSLRSNDAFQKYVVEELFLKEVNRITSIDSIPLGDEAEMGKIVAQQKVIKVALMNVISSLKK